MSKPQQETDPGLADATPEPEKRPKTTPWDPFRYLIKTISPQQRAELWRLQVPILPQEEFMTTDERRRARVARLRLRRPAIVGASAFLAVLLVLAVLAVAGGWSWRSSWVAPALRAQPALPDQPRAAPALPHASASTSARVVRAELLDVRRDLSTPAGGSTGLGRLAPATATSPAAVAPIAQRSGATESSSHAASAHPNDSKAKGAATTAAVPVASTSSSPVSKPKAPDLETPW